MKRVFLFFFIALAVLEFAVSPVFAANTQPPICKDDTGFFTGPLYFNSTSKKCCRADASAGEICDARWQPPQCNSGFDYDGGQGLCLERAASTPPPVNSVCCPADYTWCGPIGAHAEGCYKTGSGCAGETTPSSCGGGKTCNAAGTQCMAKAENPSCPPGYAPITTFLRFCSADDLKKVEGKCCAGAQGIGNTWCYAKDGGPIVTLACSDYIDNLKSVTDMTYCRAGFQLNTKTNLCEQYTADDYNITPMITCENGTSGVQSAIGCIPTGDLPSFLGFILKFALGAAGGITLLMFIVTGYTLITSTGNPEKLQAVKENLTSIFAGLVMIGFSLVLLQTIGAGILKLPSF